MTEKRLIQESRKLRRYIQRHNLSGILLGLSGGPDSVLAFHLLRMATENLHEFRLGVAHANFQLRGEESERDERFVRSLVSKYPEIDSYFRRFDTEECCRKRKISIEMGARELRHDWFDKLCTEYGYQRIATGHNADDNEETLLLNLLRGSGSRGLRGMELDNGRVIRPLLHLSRAEILELLELLPTEDRTQPSFITDSSNLTSDYRRNFLRHDVLPLLSKRWEGAHAALQTTLRLMSEENKIVEALVRKTLEGKAEILDWETLREFPSPFTLIYRWIAPSGGTPSMASEMASALPEDRREPPRTGGRWRIGTDKEVTATAAGLRMASFGKLSASTSQNISFPADSLDSPVEVTIHDLNLTEADEAERGKILTDARQSTPASIFLPGMPSDYFWRLPHKGERMRIGATSRKLISDILKEARVTAAAREGIWILCRKSDDSPVWIPGIRRAHAYLLTGKEKEIFRISLKYH